MQSAISLNPASKKFHALLGKLLIQKEPETAQKIIQMYIPSVEPTQTDQSKISFFFTSFCIHRRIDQQQHTGPQYKSSKLNQRRLFIAAMARMYDSAAYGFITSVSTVIGQDISATARMIKEVRFRYEKMKEFRDEVDLVIKNIQEDKNETL